MQSVTPILAMSPWAVRPTVTEVGRSKACGQQKREGKKTFGTHELATISLLLPPT